MVGKESSPKKYKKSVVNSAEVQEQKIKIWSFRLLSLGYKIIIPPIME